MKRVLTPALNPTGIGSALAAVYACVVMILNAVNHHTVIDPQVVIAALGAGAFLYARFKVTPLGDPRDGNGQPLKAVPAYARAAFGAGGGGGEFAPATFQEKTRMPPAAAQPAPPAPPAPPAATPRGVDISPLADPPMEDLPAPLIPPAGPPPSVSELLAPPVAPPAAPE